MELITRGCIPYQNKLKLLGLRIRGKLLCYRVLLVPGPEKVPGLLVTAVFLNGSRSFRRTLKAVARGHLRAPLLTPL